jgi:hypothetical protein
MLDDRTRAMPAEVDLANPDAAYGPGMYASIALDILALEDALHVPSRAVRGEGKERYCLVVRDDVLVRAPTDCLL